jgi:rod shape-determining protein MreC
VEKVVRDPERDSFIDIIVKPAAHLDRLDEVLVITATEPRFPPDQQQDMATSEALKGPEAAAINEKKKASDAMAERLPGLIDPNLPQDQQPLLDKSNPNSVAHPPQALHPDRFTPGMAAEPAPDANAGSKPEAKPKTPQAKEASAPNGGEGKPALKAAAKPAQQTKPRLAAPSKNKPERNP